MTYFPLRKIGRESLTAATAGLVLLILCSVVYPLAVWGLAQIAFPFQANGSLVTKQGETVGSERIGQAFAGDKYFHPRPSAAGDGYNPSLSGGSNLGPTSRKLMDSIVTRVLRYRQVNGVDSSIPLPPDAVMASASGLDPDISPRNAALQTARVARARGLGIGQVEAVVKRHTYGRALGFLGDPGVNVLEVNLALDALR